MIQSRVVGVNLSHYQNACSTNCNYQLGRLCILFWKLFSAVWTEFHSFRDRSTTTRANSGYWRALSRTLFIFSNNKVHDQPDDATDDNNNKPQCTAHSSGFRVSVYPNTEKDRYDEPSDWNKADKASEAPTPLDLSY